MKRNNQPGAALARAGSAYLIEGIPGDNPKLMGRVREDGRVSLYLEYYYGKEEAVSASGKVYARTNRRKEALGLYLWQAPRTAQERTQNREALEAARRLRYEENRRMLEARNGVRLTSGGRGDLIAWMRDYAEKYVRADVRAVRQAFKCFANFLSDPSGRWLHRQSAPKNVNDEAKRKREELTRGLKMYGNALTKKVVEAFRDYLLEHYRGEGPHSTFARFKKIVSAAAEAGELRSNPCVGVVIKTDANILVKDVLSQEEVSLLVATHYEGENSEIRRAFIFCLYCGLRWCDVKELRFSNVDFSNRVLRFEQLKTSGHSSASGVVIPLNEGLLRLIGKGERTARIFTLPSHTMCLKALRAWTAKAGIDKHITWHCARHSFAVNILNNGANIKTVSSLLGHSSLKHTEKYLRAVDRLKAEAINSLPELVL